MTRKTDDSSGLGVLGNWPSRLWTMRWIGERSPTQRQFWKCFGTGFVNCRFFRARSHDTALKCVMARNEMCALQQERSSCGSKLSATNCAAASLFLSSLTPWWILNNFSQKGRSQGGMLQYAVWQTANKGTCACRVVIVSQAQTSDANDERVRRHCVK